MIKLSERLRQLGKWTEHAHMEPRPYDAISIDDVDWGDLYEAADELERLSALIEWQPIETAPKDGTRILGCRPHYTPNTIDWNVYLEDWANHAGEDAIRVHYQPTLWQHLPEPPIGDI